MRCPLANKREIVVVLSKTPVGGVFQPNKRSRDVQFQKFPLIYMLSANILWFYEDYIKNVIRSTFMKFKIYFYKRVLYF